MEKEFEIEGRVYGLPSDLTEHQFWYLMIDFFEQNNWLFGGSLGKENISGAVYGTNPHWGKAEFETAFLDFLEKNNWTFEGTIQMILDGDYVNEDGIKEHHVLEL